MGKKGAKLTTDAESAAAELVNGLSDLGDVSSRKMFGGVGIFEGATMFGIVDSSGGIYLRGGSANAALFEQAGSVRHGKMPYFSVPPSRLSDAVALRSWGAAAVEVSRSEKK